MSGIFVTAMKKVNHTVTYTSLLPHTGQDQEGDSKYLGSAIQALSVTFDKFYKMVKIVHVHLIQVVLGAKIQKTVSKNIICQVVISGVNPKTRTQGTRQKRGQKRS